MKWTRSERIGMLDSNHCVVHHTFDDCRDVRSILYGFCVTVDELDVLIDECFCSKLYNGIHACQNMTLPRVFIVCSDVNNVVDIQLHESSKLQRLIKLLLRSNQNGSDCCGRFMFLICDECNGSFSCSRRRTVLNGKS
ncbi:hypothetical protein E2542_SST14032 [Spatholobus suberectus]|nr:hypothetical protein E2542_SST14032 [Spatholobus suberectus]